MSWRDGLESAGLLEKEARERSSLVSWCYELLR